MRTSKPGRGRVILWRSFRVVSEGNLVSDRDALERIMASLYDAMLDETHWPATSALIDEVWRRDGQCHFGRRRAEG